MSNEGYENSIDGIAIPLFWLIEKFPFIDVAIVKEPDIFPFAEEVKEKIMSMFSGTEVGFVNTSFVESSLTEIISHCPANLASIGLIVSSFLQEVNVKPANSNNVNSGLI
jgi:hypothetical protein